MLINAGLGYSKTMAVVSGIRVSLGSSAGTGHTVLDAIDSTRSALWPQTFLPAR